MRHRVRLVMLIVLFIASLTALLLLIRINICSRQSRPKNQINILTNVCEDNLSEISYIRNKIWETFYFDNGNWIYANDPKMPLNLEIPSLMYKIVTSLTSTRTITKYYNKADYGITGSSVMVFVKGKDGSSFEFVIGSYMEISDGCYIMLGGDENIYFVSGNVGAAFSYNGCDLVECYPIPKITKVNYFCIRNSGNCFEAYFDEMTSDWYSFVNSKKVILNSINTQATADMIKRLKWSGCVDYRVEESEMKHYGIDEATVITFGYDGVSYNFTFFVGLSQGSNYYARVNGSDMVLLVHGEYITPLLNASIDSLRYR
jgi:hypothetical protein